MVRTAGFVVLFLSLVACSTTVEDRQATYTEPSTFLRQEIEERIAALQYQSDQELYQNLVRLSYIGEPAIPFLLDGLHDDSARVRSACVYVLGNLRDRRTIDALISVLEDEIPFVRYEAATALGTLGERCGYPVLIAGLCDEGIRNRYKSHEALQLLTSLDFGYRHDDAPVARLLAIQKWEEWWDRMEDRPL